MSATLLTRYILANVWTRLLIFITFYFAIRIVHFVDLDFSSADCMQTDLIKDFIDKTAEEKIAPTEDKKGPLKEFFLEGCKRDETKLITEKKAGATSDRIAFLTEMETTSRKIYNILFNYDYSQSLNVTDLTDTLAEVTRVSDFNFYALKKDINLITDKIPKMIEYLVPIIAETKTSTIKEIHESIDELMNTKFNEVESRVTSQMNSRISAVEEQQKSFITQDFLEQLKSVLENKQAQHQQGVQNELTNLRENFEQRQKNISSVLKKAFEHKIEQNRIEIQNEISTLRTENSELKNIVANYIAESKSQQNLIENVRKSFEQKMNAKDLLINDLQHKNTELTKVIADMHQSQTKIIQDVSIMREHIDVLRHFQQASMHQASLETVADVKTIMSTSRTFPDFK